MIYPVEPNRDLVRELARQIRPMDEVEARLTSGLTPEGALLSSINQADFCDVILEDGVPIAIRGCGPHPVEPSIGIPWFMGTPRIDAMKFSLIRQSREWIEDMHVFWPTLVNVVYEHHEQSLRYMEALRFQERGLLHNFGVGGATFILFIREERI